jgi:hypothetical protein
MSRVPAVLQEILEQYVCSPLGITSSGSTVLQEIEKGLV